MSYLNLINVSSLAVSSCVLVEDTLLGVAGRGQKLPILFLFVVFCVFIFFK